MRRLIVSTFVSLDGVMQGPGAPQEDTSDNFTLGGWTVPFWTGDMDPAMQRAGLDSKGRDLVLGRRTYEIFAAHWPFQPASDPAAQSLNAARKHVASRTLEKLDWNNSGLLQGDAIAAIRALKASAGPDLQIIGSGGLVHGLQAAALIDEFNLLTFPVLLGRGHRLFTPDAQPQTLRLVHCETFSSGVVMTTYKPVGDVQTGSFVPDSPSAAELARRDKLQREGR